MTSLEYITLRAPIFSINPSIGGLISLAESKMSSTVYGTQTYEAVALLVCHWLALSVRDSDGSAPSGQITSERTGGLSRSFSGGFFSGTSQSTLDSDLSQTSWGLELQRLINGIVPNVFVVEP